MQNDEGAQVPQEPVTEEVTEQPVNEPTEQVQEPTQTNEGAEAPEDVEEQPYQPIDYTQFQQSQYNFQPNEDGTVDPYQFAQQIEQNMMAKVQFQQQEANAWQKIEKKYGEQLTPARREMVLNARIAAALGGKSGDLGKLADQVMAEFKTERSQGRADATTSSKVQKAASLETATSNRGETQSSALMDRIASGDKNAHAELLDQWLADGKI